MESMSHCARPGCSDSAVATLTYDYGAQTVWLDPLRPGIQASWPLCLQHAESLTVPLGWDLHDRRTPTIVGSSLAS